MRIAFGLVPDEYNPEEGEYFTGTNGKPYYFELAVDEEGDGCGSFRISDTVGRDIPMDFNQLDDTIKVLTTLQHYLSDKAKLKAIWEEIWAQG